MSTIGHLGPAFQTSALAGSALQKSAQNHRLFALGLLLQAARVHEAMRRQNERQQLLATQGSTPNTPGPHAGPIKLPANELAAATLKLAHYTQPIAHGESFAQQLSQLGSAALSFLGVPSTQRLEQLEHPPGLAHNGEPVGLGNLAQSAISKGTTQPLTVTQRHEAMHNETAQPGSQAESYTRRNLNKGHAPAPATAFAHKNVPSSDNGDVTVTLSPSQARKLGLLKPQEKDRSISLTLPKNVARELGFVPSKQTQKQVTAKAQAHNSGAALSLAGQIL